MLPSIRGIKFAWIQIVLFFILWLFVFSASAMQQSDRLDQNSGSQESAAWKITLIDNDEPGLPMVVSGIVYASDGLTPVAGITVHAYHTDERGYYSRDGRNEREHRINGNMVTNERGQFEFTSIKPASYPNSRVPSHIHFVVSETGYVTQRFNLEFKGDPHLTQAQIRQAEEAGKFASIRPLVKDGNGVLRCTYNIRLRR